MTLYQIQISNLQKTPIEEPEDDFDFATEDTLNLPLNDVQVILAEGEDSEEENEDDAGQASAEEESQDHSSSDLDETELEDTIIDTSISASIDVDLSQFESEIYEYFVPEDASQVTHDVHGK